MNRARAVALAFAGALLLAAAAALGGRNVGNTAMCWDEAAQFWVSQGLSNYSAPFALRSSIRDVVRRNCSENLDPGGFSLLLHAWTAAGRGLEWLRGLPFAFFLLGAATLGALGWRLTGSAAFAIAAAAAPALFPAVLHFAFEIRAYSMEMAGIAVGALALAAAIERPTPGRAAGLGIVLGAFLSSRYSYALFAAAALTAFAFAIARRDAGDRTRARLLAAALLPVVVAAALGWQVTLRHQLWPEMRRGPAGVQSPLYTAGSVVGRSGRDAALVRRNLLSPAALPLTACLLFVALVRPRGYAVLAEAGAIATLQRRRAAFSGLHAATLGTLALSIAASLLGAYPWDIASRWSAYLVMVSALALVVMAAEAATLACAAIALRGSYGLRARRLGGALALLVATAGVACAATYRYDAPWGRWSDVTVQVAALPVRVAEERSVLVTFYEAPVLRYLYEHGPLAGRAEYPRAFRFETRVEWQRRSLTDLPGEGIAFVISGEGLAVARARFLGAALRPLGPDEGPPYAVVGPAARSHGSATGTDEPSHRTASTPL